MIGVCVDDFRLSAQEGLREAARLGFGLVEIGAARGQISPAELSHSGRRHLKRFVGGLGLSITALRADAGPAIAIEGSGADQQLQLAKDVIELARDIEVQIVCVSLGSFNGDDAKNHEPFKEVLHHLADHADKLGRFVAIETVADKPGELSRLLAELSCPFLKVSYDPGALLMVGLDPLAAIEPLADDIVLAHMRDATLGSPQRPGREANLGQGNLSVQAYLAHLAQAGYEGGQIIRRAHSDSPIADLQSCKNYLESILAPPV